MKKNVKVMAAVFASAALFSFAGCSMGGDDSDDFGRAVVPTQSNVASANLLSELDSSSWVFNVYGSGVAATNTAGKVYKVSVTQANMDLTNYSNGIQLKHVIKVSDNKTYSVKFDIACSKAGEAKWAVMSGEPDYAWYGGENLTFTAGEKKSVALDVTLSSSAASNAFKPSLETTFGIDFLSTGEFTIENVSVTEKGAVQPSDTPAGAPAGSPAGSGAAWEGNTVFEGWTATGDDVNIAKDKITANTTGLKISWSASADAGITLKMQAMNWGAPGNDVKFKKSDDPDFADTCYLWATTTETVFTFKPSDLAKVKEYGVQVYGDKITITKVEIVE